MPFSTFPGLFSLYALFPLSLSFYIPNQSPLSFDDQVRERHLYTENKRQGLFLEISQDGSVRGSPVQTANSVLELRAVRPGETVIKGVSSSLYLCADSSGHLRGQGHYKEADCTFRELLQADGYTIFLSPHHGLPISLSTKQTGLKYGRPLSQFLPIMNRLVSGMERTKKENEMLKVNVDPESDDPLGMMMAEAAALLSPGFLSR